MSYLECAESQLAEIELLTSMFPTVEELEFIDQLALAELRNYVEGSALADSPPPSRPQFLIKQKLESASMEEDHTVPAPRHWCCKSHRYEDITIDHQGEDGKIVESIDSLRKFTGFEEAMFDPHGNRGNHMDLGQLYQFLNEKGCCDVFQIYFGIEGR